MTACQSPSHAAALGPAAHFSPDRRYRYWLARDVLPIGPDNDDTIRREATLADRVVIAWGAHGHLFDRGARVLDLLRLIGIRPFCLTRTNGGQPGHPLYLPKDLAAVPFERGLAPLPAAATGGDR